MADLFSKIQRKFDFLAYFYNILLKNYECLLTIVLNSLEAFSMTQGIFWLRETRLFLEKNLTSLMNSKVKGYSKLGLALFMGLPMADLVLIWFFVSTITEVNQYHRKNIGVRLEPRNSFGGIYFKIQRKTCLFDLFLE